MLTHIRDSSQKGSLPTTVQSCSTFTIFFFFIFCHLLSQRVLLLCHRWMIMVRVLTTCKDINLLTWVLFFQPCNRDRMFLERSRSRALLDKWAHTPDGVPPRTQSQGSTHSPQETGLSSLPAWFWHLLTHFHYFLVFQAHDHIKTIVLGMAHEFNGQSPESQVEFQNSWETSDWPSSGEGYLYSIDSK